MNEDIRSKTYGILIHSLPLEFYEEVSKLFSEKYVRRVFLDKGTGPEVYFNKYEYARKIIKQKIQIEGISYTVSPLVTNITVYNIRYYEFKSEVLQLLTYYGRIIDHYAVKDSYSERFTDDYRIILDVPEVLADFNLPYLLHLPSDTRHSFKVDFFCRLCRENGHKQYECPKYFPPSRKEENYSKDVRSSKRRLTCGKGTNNFSARDDCLPSEIQQMDFSDAEFEKDGCWRSYKQGNNDRKEKEDQKNEETEILSLPTNDVLRGILKVAEAQKQHRYSVIKTDNNHLEERVTFDETLEHKNTHHESTDTKYKHLVQNKGSTIQEKTICEWRPIEEDVPNTSIPNNTIRKKAANNCKIKGSPFRRRKRAPLMKIQPVLTALSEKLLTQAYDTKPKDISPNMEQKLRNLLQHLTSVQNGNRELRNHRDFLDRFLDRVVSERRILKRSTMKQKDAQPTQSSETLPSGPSSRKKKTDLSQGIKNVISKVNGVLPPPDLCKFLNQVRCRRKKIEIARYFTANISALALQLLKVVETYYVRGDKGPSEDIDIRFIKSVAGVLKADIGKTAAPIIKKEPTSEL